MGEQCLLAVIESVAVPYMPDVIASSIREL